MVLYLYTTLTILYILHSIEIAVFLLVCAFVIHVFADRYLFLFNVDVNWLSGFASPPWLFQAASTLTFTLNIFYRILYFFPLAKE